MSSVDFNVTLEEVDTAGRIATLVARHVPPVQPQVHLKAAWMETPVADTRNNSVQIAADKGQFVTSVGKEIFNVQLEVSLEDGKILSATMDNPVETIERDCKDAQLTDCGPRRHRIVRTVAIKLMK